MSDKLEWLNRHFVLLRHRTLREAVDTEKYKLRPDLEPLTRPGMSSEEFLLVLRDAGKFKEACDFLAYTMHRRAAVWWGYRCLLSLNEELEQNPAVERDIADIGAPKPMPVPDWAKMPPEPEAPSESARQAEARQRMAQINATVEEAKKLIPPDVQKYCDDLFQALDSEFEKTHGIRIQDLLNKAAEQSAGPLFTFDENSPVFQAEKELRSKIESVRKETVDLIKTVIPPKMPDWQKKMRDDAMQAVYRWVIAPDEANSQAALDIGNACPDQPAGLMAMAAFWSFGNLTPEGKQVVATPPGLAANGISSALLQAGLLPGGTRKYKERCELYFNLGLKVAWGEDTWGETPEKPLPPHRTTPSASAPREAVPSGYAKWNVKPPRPQGPEQQEERK